MKNSKTTRKALFASALSLVLTTSMMIGTTWAWFTDTATSANNKIQSGTLNIDLAVKNGDNYQSVKASNDPIFNYDRWEPGYTEWSNVKVSTEGNLALKYTLKFVSTGDVASSKLAEVIDVYYSPTEIAKTTDRPEDLESAGLRKLGTLKDVFTGGDSYEVNDTLTPAEAAADAGVDVDTEDYATIVFKMQESAGNEYQNQTIPAFDLAVVATQNTVEKDSFDNQYDKNATYPVVVKSASQMNSAIANAKDGDTIVAENPITGNVVVSNDKEITIDLKGNDVNGALAVYGGDVTVKTGGADISGGSNPLAVQVAQGGKLDLDLDGTTLDKPVYVNGGELKVDDGTINADGDQAIYVQSPAGNDSHVTIGKDTVVDGGWGVTLHPNYSSDSANDVIDVYGTINSNIFVSGNLKSGNSVVNVYGKVNGSDTGIGVAVNGHATVNVKNGAEISGGTGVEVRAGNLNVESGTKITGTATPTNVSPNGSGTTTQGAGIGVSQHTTKLPINVVINGGTISGHTPLYEANPQNNSDEDLAKINIAVNGGTFTCINGGTNKFSIADEDKITYTNSVQ